MLPVGEESQASHEAAVAEFLAAHPLPVAPSASASAAELSKSRSVWYAYLTSVPWTDVFGQWGCTVHDLHIVMTSAADGNTYPAVQDVAECGGVEALTGVVGTLETKTSVLAQPANAHLRASLAAVSSAH